MNETPRFMKKIVLYLSLLSIGSMLFFNGCSKNNPEPSPSDPRQQYIGSWGVTENPLKNYYSATISADPNSSDGLLISNFAASGSSVMTHATVSGNSVTVTSQQISNGWFVSGTGTYSSGKITWPYTINDGANSKNYIGIFAKL